MGGSGKRRNKIKGTEYFCGNSREIWCLDRQQMVYVTSPPVSPRDFSVKRRVEEFVWHERMPLPATQHPLSLSLSLFKNTTKEELFFTNSGHGKKKTKRPLFVRCGFQLFLVNWPSSSSRHNCADTLWMFPKESKDPIQGGHKDRKTTETAICVFVRAGLNGGLRTFPQNWHPWLSLLCKVCVYSWKVEITFCLPCFTHTPPK